MINNYKTIKRNSMVRKIKILIIALFIILAIAACGNDTNASRRNTSGVENEEQEKENHKKERSKRDNKNDEFLVVTVNGNTEFFDLKKGAKFTFTIANKKYNGKISNLEGDDITIKLDSYGLIKANDNGTINLRAKEDKFIFSKQDDLELHAQITGAGAVVKFSVTYNTELIGDNKGKDAEKGNKNKHSEKAWDFEISPYGMPELELTDDDIIVVDDNHPELAKALEEALVLPEGASTQSCILYRIDDSIVSIERAYIEGNAEVSYYKYDFMVFSTMGEQLTLDNVGDNIIDNCHDLLVDAYNEYKTTKYDLNAGSVDLIDENTPWIIDTNSIAFFLSSDEYDYVSYRIYFDDNPYINPKVIPGEKRMFSYIAGGCYTYGEDKIYPRRGSAFDVGTFKSLECGLYINDDDYNHIYDIIDSTIDPINGYVTNRIYVDDSNELYVFVDGYYRKKNAIDGEDRYYFYGIYMLKDGKLILIDSKKYGTRFYDEELGHYKYDDDFNKNIYWIPHDEMTLDILIEIALGDKD